MQWIFYALWHGIIIFFTVLYVLNQPMTMQEDGKDIGFWVAGMAIYGVCIFVANFELALRFNTHSWLGVLTLLAGVIAYFFFYSILSFVFKGEIDHLFVPSFKIKILWVSIVFCLVQTYVIESIFKFFHARWKAHNAAKQESKQKKN